MAIARPLLAYSLIWLIFLAVRPARVVVLTQLSALRGAATPRMILKGFAVGAVLVAVNAGLLVWFDAFVASATPGLDMERVAVAVVFVLAVAATEEMILRGVLFTRLREVSNDGVAIGITALIFAIMHVGRGDFGLANAVQYLADGLLLGWLVARTGVIWAGVGLHAAKNLGVTLLFGTTRHLVEPWLQPATETLIDFWLSAGADLVAYVVAIGLAVALFANTDRRRPQPHAAPGARHRISRVL